MESRYFYSVVVVGGLLAWTSLCYAAPKPIGQDDSWGVALSTGHGTRHVRPYRLSLSRTYGPIWLENTSWPLHFTWESSAAHWRAERVPDSDGPYTLNLVTTGPMFRFQKATPFLGMLPYIEGGVGASWLSEKEISGRRLSLHFQFEDKIGVGVRFGPAKAVDIGFRLCHYSNASLKTPNSGMNMYMVSFGVWMPTH